MHCFFLHFVEVSTHGGLLGGGDGDGGGGVGGGGDGDGGGGVGVGGDGDGGGGVGGAEGGRGPHRPQVFLHFCSFAAS